ncbi:MAG: hypothetical protein U0791_18680 [Gemmataceae bacterium]
MPLRLRAPTRNGEVLAEPHFDRVPELVERNRAILNRAEFPIDGTALFELRKLARRELQLAGAEPLLIGGHQPELSHPGVWAKNFALNGLARKLGGTPLHLIANSDTPKSAAIKVPVFEPGDPLSVSVESVPFDTLAEAPAYEEYSLSNSALFASFPERLQKLCADWLYRPLALDLWPRLDERRTVEFHFTTMRVEREQEWGCRNIEQPVSSISGLESFRRFVKHIVADLPRFRDAYNGAIREYRRVNRIRSRTHPAPELEANEAPFWVLTDRGRRKLSLRDGEPLPEQIRPRALTLTLFARLLIGDFFLHGIGGGKYDEVTDAIIRNYFGIEPPAYQVVSATLHLPLPGFPSTDADLASARRRVRDLQWNPQRNVVPPSSDDRFVLRLVADRETLAASEPPLLDRAARRKWYRKLADLNEQLRHHVWKQVPPAKANLARVEAEVRANAVLRSRDYSWVLFPEEPLKPFLQQFLDVCDAAS